MRPSVQVVGCGGFPGRTRRTRSRHGARWAGAGGAESRERAGAGAGAGAARGAKLGPDAPGEGARLRVCGARAPRSPSVSPRPLSFAAESRGPPPRLGNSEGLHGGGRSRWGELTARPGLEKAAGPARRPPGSSPFLSTPSLEPARPAGKPNWFAAAGAAGTSSADLLGFREQDPEPDCNGPPELADSSQVSPG